MYNIYIYIYIFIFRDGVYHHFLDIYNTLIGNMVSP